MIPTPTGPVRCWVALVTSGSLAVDEVGPAVPDRLEQVPRAVVELDDTEGVGLGLDEVPDRQRTGADRNLLLGVLAPVAVLDVQREDAVAETLEQGRDVRAARVGPVGVHLQPDLGSQVLGEDLETVLAVDHRLELE